MKKIIYGLLAFSPVLAFAQSTAGTLPVFTNLANTFSKVIAILIPAFFGLAVIYFFYGVADYILAAGDPKKAAEGKSIMIYGLIAIAVMASLWGIINFLQVNLLGGADTGGTFKTPGITGGTINGQTGN